MNKQFDFRALLLRIQELLSDNDRHRLHFLLGEDVPRYLRDDLSLGGTLRLLDSLFEKTFISDQDCDYLIEAFKKIQCYDAAKRLQGSVFIFLKMIYIERRLYVFQNINKLGKKVVHEVFQFKIFFFKTMKRITSPRLVCINTM
jgi:hypothetical protein